jgi:hypothetical protein
MKKLYLLALITGISSLQAAEDIQFYIKNDTKHPVIAYLSVVKSERLPLKSGKEQYFPLKVTSDEIIGPKKRIGPFTLYNPEEVRETEFYHIEKIEVAWQDSPNKKYSINTAALIKKAEECNEKVIEIVLKKFLFGVQIMMYPQCELKEENENK